MTAPVRDIVPIKIGLDGSAFLTALEELTLLAPALPKDVGEFLVRLFDAPDLSAQLACIEQDGLTTPGAGELRIRLKPSDRFLVFMAAARAGNCELVGVEKIFGHDSGSVGCVNSNNGDPAPGESQGSPGKSQGGAP
jgi:hypothetical protein